MKKKKQKHLFSIFFISFLQLRFSLRWIFQMFSLPLQSSKLDFWCSSRRRRREEAGCNFHLVQFFFQSFFSFAHFRYILDIKCRYTYFKHSNQKREKAGCNCHLVHFVSFVHFWYILYSKCMPTFYW